MATIYLAGFTKHLQETMHALSIPQRFGNKIIAIRLEGIFVLTMSCF